MAGIGEPKREKLFTIGIRTVADLAVADADEVVKVRGLGKAARLWPLRARAVKTGQPVLIEPWAPPVVDYELSYDVENTPAPFVYLHGLLLRKSGGKPFSQPGFGETDFGTFDPVCATHPETEAEVWARFMEKVEDWTSRGTFVVYIYSPHERGVLRRLKRLYGGSEALERFEEGIIDLCKAVKRSVVLPTDGDGLKTVAAQIGFHWRDKTPGGQQSITWWNEYWADPEGNASLRDRVLAYNEDDVRATFAIRDWLCDFAKDANTGLLTLTGQVAAEAAEQRGRPGP
jgi:predicted RecB family nuclease